MRPLEGITVVALEQVIAGPFATRQLAELGARVIKIERPDGGDPARGYDRTVKGQSSHFAWVNRSKESLALDLKNPADLASLKTLLTKADVVLQNFRPGVIERLGLDYEAVKAINPRIVYASITGYGTEGPWVMRPGQDLLAQARAGLMWLNGDEGQGPVPFGLAVADMLAGYDKLAKLADGRVDMVVPGHDAEVMTKYPASRADLKGVSVRLD